MARIAEHGKVYIIGQATDPKYFSGVIGMVCSNNRVITYDQIVKIHQVISEDKYTDTMTKYAHQVLLVRARDWILCDQDNRPFVIFQHASQDY